MLREARGQTERQEDVAAPQPGHAAAELATGAAADAVAPDRQAAEPRETSAQTSAAQAPAFERPKPLALAELDPAKREALFG